MTASEGFSPQEFRPFKLAEVQEISWNTKLFRFELPTPDSTSGLPVASCIMVKGTGQDGNEVARPYTPISPVQQKGLFDLLIKRYPKGNVSVYLHERKAGDTVDIKGPFEKIPYKANMCKKIGMIAGGTGITPMVQVLHEILANPDDKTEVALIFGNETEEDILMRDWLEETAKKHPNQFTLYQVVNKPGPNWKQGKGYVTMDMIKDFLPPPPPSETTNGHRPPHMVFVCGPPGLYKAVSGDKAPDKSQGPLTGLLKDRGYTEQSVFKF